MKRKFLILFITIFAGLLFGCAASATLGVQELNDNFNGEFKFAAPMPKDTEETGIYDDFTFPGGGFGCTDIESKDQLTKYRFAGYPDTSDKYKMTSIDTEDPKYEFFGFSVGDPAEIAAAVLKEHGYKLKETLGLYSVYRLGRIRFLLNAEGDIDRIFVSLESTNRRRVQY